MKPYASAIANAFGSTSAGNAPNIDFLSDDIRIALVADTYTPDLAAHDFWNDVVAHEVAGTGYTANGAALASKAMAVTAANAWATAHATSTAYALGDIVRPSAGNGYLYRASVAGTSGGSAPTWPTTIGATVTDGGVTWTNVGVAAIVLDAADPSWAGASLTARYAVAYNRTPATDATRPLLGLSDFGSNKTASGGTFAITFASAGMIVVTVG